MLDKIIVSTLISKRNMSFNNRFKKSGQESTDSEVFCIYKEEAILRLWRKSCVFAKHDGN